MTTIKVKCFFIILCLTVFVIPLQSQDLIVTNDGDSLNCRITKVKSDNIYFIFKHKDEVRNTLLPISKVADYQMDYYPTAEVPANKITDNDIYPHFRIAVSSGWSYRTASISSDTPSDFKNYTQNLKSGFHYEAGISYYFTELLGIGLKYNEFLSSNKIENVYVTYFDDTTEYGSMSDNIRIKFIGPVFTTRLFNSSKKNCLLTDLGLGYMDYRNKAFLVSTPINIKGSTVGLYWSVGYDLGISENLALGFQVSLLTGTLTQLTTFNGTSTQKVKLDKDKYENLSRIDLSIGLRFNK